MILIISYGNTLRRDDGAGLALAETMEREWLAHGLEVRLVAVHQPLPELAEEIARPEVSAVIFVDARVAVHEAEEPGVQMSPVVAGGLSPALGHHLDAAALLTCAGQFYGRQPPGWMVTAPGVDFGYGEELSETARKALELCDVMGLLPPGLAH